MNVRTQSISYQNYRMSLISVIVPVYNSIATLNRCVSSLLSQTYGHFELILVDDGSNDGSSELCDSLQTLDNRIKVLHKFNGGASSARNYGLECSIGDYICFVDSDDWVDEDYLESLIPSESEDITICSIRLEGRSNEILGFTPKYICKDDFKIYFNSLLEHMSLCSPCCKLFRRSVIEAYHLNFDTRISAGEDMIFVYNYLCTELNCIKLIDRPLYHYRVLDNQSLSNRIVPYEVSFYIMDRLFEVLGRLSNNYLWNSELIYKRLLCTHLNNLLAVLKSERRLLERFKLLKSILKNTHIQSLLNDHRYFQNKYADKGIKYYMMSLCLYMIKPVLRIV